MVSVSARSTAIVFRLFVCIFISIGGKAYGSLQNDIDSMGLSLTYYTNDDRSLYMYAVDEMIDKSDHDAAGSIAVIRMMYFDSSDLRYAYYYKILAQLAQMEGFSDDYKLIRHAVDKIDQIQNDYSDDISRTNEILKFFSEHFADDKTVQTWVRSNILKWDSSSNLRWVKKRLVRIPKFFETVGKRFQYLDYSMRGISATAKVILAANLETALLLERLEIIRATVSPALNDDSFDRAIDDLMRKFEEDANNTENEFLALLDAPVDAIKIKMADGTLDDVFYFATEEYIKVRVSWAVATSSALKISKAGRVGVGLIVTEGLGELARELLTAPRNILDHYIIATIVRKGFGIDPLNSTTVQSIFDSEVYSSYDELSKAQLGAYLSYMFYKNMAAVMGDTGWVDLVMFFDSHVDRKEVQDLSERIAASLEKEYARLTIDDAYIRLIVVDNGGQCYPSGKEGSAITLAVENLSSVDMLKSYDWHFINLQNPGYDKDYKVENFGEKFKHIFGSSGVYSINVVGETHDGTVVTAQTNLTIKPSWVKPTNLVVWPEAPRLKYGDRSLSDYLDGVLLSVIEYNDGTYEYVSSNSGCPSIEWSIEDEGVLNGSEIVNSIYFLSPQKIGKTTVSANVAGLSSSVEVEVTPKWLKPIGTEISSYFDHTIGSSGRYVGDGSIVTYDGVTASATGNNLSDGNCGSVEFDKPGGKKILYSYRSANDGECIAYDGHPGTDYRSGGKMLSVFSVAAGKVVNKGCPTASACGGCVGSQNETKNNGTLEIYHEGSNLTTCYLHLSSIAPNLEVGTHVQKGIEVGKTGNIGTDAIHLHFEVRDKDNRPLDPYGWDGNYSDPYTLATNINLWDDVEETAYYAEIFYPEVTVGSLDKSIGRIHVSTLNGDSFDTSGTVKINGVQVAVSEWSNSRLILENVFNDIEDVVAPINIKIYDRRNNLVVDTFYPYVDLAGGTWYGKATLRLWAKDILVEQEDGEFSPSEFTNKAEFIAVLSRSHAAVSVDPAERDFPAYSGIFDDTNPEDWWAREAQYAWDQGWPIDCSNVALKYSFCPAINITRAQAARLVIEAFMARSNVSRIFSAYIGAQGEEKIPVSMFKDVQDASNEDYPYVYTAKELGIVHGSPGGLFQPDSIVSRAEMVKMICVGAFGPKACLDIGDIVYDVDRDNGVSTLIATDPEVDFSVGGTVKVDSEEVRGDWQSAGIRLDHDLVPSVSPEGLRGSVLLEAFSSTSSTQYFTGLYPYNDIPNDEWFTPYVLGMWRTGIMEGYPLTALFRPNYSTTREEFVAATVRAMFYGEEPPAVPQNFVDVQADRWSSDYIGYAEQKGWIEGYTDNGKEFRPERVITRAEATKIVIEAFHSTEFEQLTVGQINGFPAFSDVLPEAWYHDYVLFASSLDILQGYQDGSFGPNDPLTRAQTAKIVCIAAFSKEQCETVGGLIVPSYPHIVDVEFDNSSGELTFHLADSSDLPGSVFVNGLQRGDIAAWGDGFTLRLPLYKAVGEELLGMSTLFGVQNPYGQKWLKKPVWLEVYDRGGREIYVGCFPFVDLCGEVNNKTPDPREWYVAPIVRLWDGGVVEGLSNGTSGQFKPLSTASRAELVAAVVRAHSDEELDTGGGYWSFEDVPVDAWFAAHVAYARSHDFISGCNEPDNTEFCPAKPITRAEAAKVIALALLPEEVARFESGHAPPWQFSDVTSTSEWFYPYVYALQSANAAHGYGDGTFKPHEQITRAEMAKLICVAKYGVEQCIDMGSLEGGGVESVTPLNAILGELTTFTVDGFKLPPATAFFVGDCANLVRLENSPEQVQYQCVPSNSGGIKSGVVKDEPEGTVLYRFTVDVAGDPAATPVVDSVTPTSALLDQSTVFTVTGSNLPDATAFFIGECADLISLGGTSEQRQFQCTPSYTTGIKSGVVKDEAGGSELFTFTVDVQDEASCSPTVSSVSPLDATLGQATTFTVTGSCLPSTTAFFVGDCADLVDLGGSASQRTYQCTPSYSEGSKYGVVKDAPGGNILEEFQVQVSTAAIEPPSCDPMVDSVAPLTAKVDKRTTFTVTGSCLPNTTAFFIGNCLNVTPRSGGTETQREFDCTPNYEDGPQEGLVKDVTGGEVLRAFTVDFEWDTPVVTSVVPTTANLGASTEFLVRGTSLPPGVVMWLDWCDGSTASVRGHSTERAFVCTPQGDPVTRYGVVKEYSGGPELKTFGVTYQ